MIKDGINDLILDLLFGTSESVNIINIFNFACREINEIFAESNYLFMQGKLADKSYSSN